ncbi:hypothetical protein NDU88_005404 [Pleurodeles waltl]|uniref:Uncharacterized protein n=1 Tax=Pleurodeles waltl TaxID=8319 RepID=A0AAV7TVC1_PLEWA|nr:hypothetical protein NDU88_005404 [Pleurodeles waltl]
MLSHHALHTERLTESVLYTALAQQYELPVQSPHASSPSEGQTKEKKHSNNGAGVEVKEAEGEEPGSQDTGKEKNSGKKA